MDFLRCQVFGLHGFQCLQVLIQAFHLPDHGLDIALLEILPQGIPGILFFYLVDIPFFPQMI